LLPANTVYVSQFIVNVSIKSSISAQNLKIYATFFTLLWSVNALHPQMPGYYGRRNRWASRNTVRKLAARNANKRLRRGRAPATRKIAAAGRSFPKNNHIAGSTVTAAIANLSNLKSFTGLPKSAKTTFRWAATYTFSLNVVGGQATRAIRCNSPYDPDVAVGGVSALNFAAWANMYDHYVVTGSRIMVTATGGADDTPNIPLCVSITMDDTVNTNTDFNVIQAQPNSCWQILQAETSQMIGKMSAVYNPLQYWGISKRELITAYTNHGALTSGVPTEDVNWIIALNTMDGSQLNRGYLINVVCEYDTVFLEAKTLDATTVST